jgi:hypothetical protein
MVAEVAESDAVERHRANRAVTARRDAVLSKTFSPIVGKKSQHRATGFTGLAPFAMKKPRNSAIFLIWHGPCTDWFIRRKGRWETRQGLIR